MKYALKKIRSIRVEGLGSEKGLHKATLNDLKNISIKGSNDTEYAEGTDGARLAAFDIKKVSTVEGTNGAIDSGFLALQVGDEEKVVENGTDVKIRESHVLTDAEATAKSFALKYKASGTAGVEIGYVYKADVNGNPDKVYKQGSTAAAGVFTYTAGTKAIAFAEGDFAAGDTIIIDYYPKFSSYTVVTNDATKFSVPGKIYVDAWFTDLCTEEDVPLQMVLDKGKISGEYDYSFGDSAAVQNFTVEALAPSCGENKALWKLYTYDMELAEA